MYNTIYSSKFNDFLLFLHCNLHFVIFNLFAQIECFMSIFNFSHMKTGTIIVPFPFIYLFMDVKLGSEEVEWMRMRFKLIINNAFKMLHSYCCSCCCCICCHSLLVAARANRMGRLKMFSVHFQFLSSLQKSLAFKI